MNILGLSRVEVKSLTYAYVAVFGLILAMGAVLVIVTNMYVVGSIELLSGVIVSTVGLGIMVRFGQLAVGSCPITDS